MARVLVVEPVAQPGLDLLSAAHDAHLRLGLDRGALLGTLGEGGGWDALVVRSQTRVDAELLGAAAPRLSVVGVARGAELDGCVWTRSGRCAGP